MSEPAPRFDYGALGAPHLQMILNNVLTVWGLPAKVYQKILYQNEYSAIRPEFTMSTIPSDSIRILVGNVMQGFNVSGPFISLADKFQNEVQITTNAALKTDDEVEVTFSDNKKLRYRITLPIVINAYSQMFYSYKALLI